MQNTEIEFQNTEKDYLDFHKILVLERFQKYAAFLSLLLLVICLIAISTNSWPIGITIVMLYLVYIFARFYLVPLWRGKIKIRKSLADNIASTEKRKLTITDEGLHTQGSEFDVLRIWASIKLIRKKQGYIQIITSGDEYFILAEKWFSSEAESSNFIGFVNSKITYKAPVKPIKPKYSFADSTKSSPPYLLGLLGFIPLIGAFVGVALILYGLIKYKDKWLVLIGVGGIAFTVIVYSSLFYVGFKSNFGKQGFAQISQTELNDLVKQVEFYKIQHGAYPDSLQQLDIKGGFTNIHDPLIDIDNKDKKNDVYNYHRIGNKYTLFSSGLDEKPNTKDDIYPSLEIDTNKIGLIINRK